MKKPSDSDDNDNNNDKVLPLGPAAETVGHGIARTTGRRRMDLLLSKSNAGALIQALPTEDLYLLIKDVGLADSSILVGLATPEQFQGFIDLEAWTPGEFGSALDRHAVLEWLEVARDGYPARYRAKLEGLDLEILERLLQGGLYIVDRREEEESIKLQNRPGPEDLGWELTPCTNFFIAYSEPDSPSSKALARLIFELYDRDVFGTTRLLSAVRYELQTELDEAALKIRAGRMEDMGFPPIERALEIYAYRRLDTKLPDQPRAPEAIPGFALASISRECFLFRAARSITGIEARTQLDRSLLYLCNMALVADRVQPGDSDLVQEVTRRVHATLSLALETLSSGDETLAGTLLSTKALKTLFQLGHSLGLDLARRLADLLKDSGKDLPEALGILDEPEAGVVLALLGSRPRYARAVEVALARGWPNAPSAFVDAGELLLGELPEGQRGIESRKDLETLGWACDAIEAALALTAEGGPLFSEDPEAPSLSRRAATYVVQAASASASPQATGPSARAATLQPLSLDQARSGLGLLLPQGGADAALWERAASGLGTEQDAARGLIARALAKLLTETVPVVAAGSDLDPRLLDRLWLREGA